MLHINELTFRIEGRVLFDAATAALPDRRRAGLVGRNGTGKSTLLRLIAGELQPDAGGIALRPGMRIGLVSQTAPGGERSVIDTVLDADIERSRLLSEADTAVDPTRIAEIHTRLADIDAHAAPARAARILSGLGFDEAAQGRPCGSFSGGWRMRIALAAALFAAPDLLLLDEPSNHLDLEATMWLEGYLATYPGTLLIASHDRDLLNKAATHTLHLDQGKLTLYSGGYDAFERARREKLSLQAATHARQEAQRRHMQAFVDRFRYTASKARQAQSRLKALARMEPVSAVVEDPTISFSFPQPDPLAPPLLRIENGAVGYATDQPVLRHLDLRIDMDDRIALLGANGNGKSTLLRLLSQRLALMSGEQHRSGKLEVGYYAQDAFEQVDPHRTALDHVTDVMPQATETVRRAQLGRFGLSGPKAEQEAGKLSGGERARLVFALISRKAPHLLLLDEPTNHLDVDSREALVAAINEFEGAVILVTHDSHLVELCADRLWLVADGGCRPFEGDMDDYRRLLARQRGEEREDKGKAKVEPRQSKKEARRTAAANRAEVAPLKRAVRDAEKRLESLTRERDAVAARLADPKLYDGPADAVTDLNWKQADLARAIETAEEEWLAAQEALEAAEAEII